MLSLARPSLSLLVLLSACAPLSAEPPLFNGGLAPLHVDAPPRLSLDAESCARCHPRVAAQWRASGHAGAFSDLDFQLPFQAEPQGWCVQCHLPLAEAQEEAGGRTTVAGGDFSGAEVVPGGLSEQGVSCAVCHVRGGEVMTAGSPSWKARLAHPVRQSPQLGTSDFCGGCHQFNLPLHGLLPQDQGWPFAYSELPLQDTLGEHATAEVGGQRCQDCHMPKGAHRFPGGHDAGFVGEALTVEVSVADGVAEARVEARGVGHAVPTGDPFRALILELCADASCAEVLGRARMGRTWTSAGKSWRLVSDTRVPPPSVEGDPGVRELTVPVTSTPTAWRLTLNLADRSLHELLPPEHRGGVVLEGAVLAQEGADKGSSP